MARAVNSIGALEENLALIHPARSANETVSSDFSVPGRTGRLEDERCPRNVRSLRISAPPRAGAGSARLGPRLLGQRARRPGDRQSRSTR